jgi:hypothetical protein
VTIKEVRRWLESAEATWRKDLLVDLANLEDSDCERFWRSRLWLRSPGGIRREQPDYIDLLRQQADNAELLQIRNDLRAIWDRRPDSNLILNSWLEWRSASLRPFLPMIQMGYVRPNPVHLRVQLVFGVCESATKLAHCQAEGCPSPYFLRYRDERQRFCDRPQCLEFGQRLHKKVWARKARKEKKEQRSKRGRGVSKK